MPEFGDFLNWLERLRLGIRARTVGQLARDFRQFARDHQVDDDVSRLRALMLDEIARVHGEDGAEEFRQNTQG